MKTIENDPSEKVFPQENPEGSGVKGDLIAPKTAETSVSETTKESTSHVPFGEDQDVIRATEHTPVAVDSPEDIKTVSETASDHALAVTEPLAAPESATEWITDKVVHTDGVAEADAADILDSLLQKTQRDTIE